MQRTTFNNLNRHLTIYRPSRVALRRWKAPEGQLISGTSGHVKARLTKDSAMRRLLEKGKAPEGHPPLRESNLVAEKARHRYLHCEGLLLS